MKNKICIVCGKEFEPSSGAQKCCSKECSKVNNKQYKAEYRQVNKDKYAEYQAKYHQTPQGRANRLLASYKRADRKADRGECTLTPDWIVENIFNGGTTNKCHYCGKELPFTELGCDRKDSTLPHTPENCVPCCFECNRKKHTTPYAEYVAKLVRDRFKKSVIS